MAKPTPLSGFPEWLPAQRIVEQQILKIVQETFELHGFASIETRAVEPLEQLLSKGETSKEVYLLNRLQAAEGEEQSRDKQLGLHFDLTVPFARYVLENAGHLAFPFKRYQIQKVWRGERPQDGRFREFYQADIDVVGAGELPYHFEVELPLVMAEAFGRLRSLGVPEFKILVNNRRVSEGFYRGLGLNDIEGVLRNIDKLDKIGADKVRELLVDETGASQQQAQLCLDLAGISGTDASVIGQVRALAEGNGVAHELLEQGLNELEALLNAAAVRAPGTIEANLKIARGLDYYTGCVYESVLIGHEDLGSICSGGRYDTLASAGRWPVHRCIAFGLAVALEGNRDCVAFGSHRSVGGRLGRGTPCRIGSRRCGLAGSRYRHGCGSECSEVWQADQVR
jgi:histidyl-tRNA synthetase